jgi:hypothetical protein
MFTIISPSNYRQERAYIINLFFDDFLGLEYQMKFGDYDHIAISDRQTELRVADIFFKIPKKKWLMRQSLPSEPLKTLDVKKLGLNCNFNTANIPIIFGDDIENSFDSNYLAIDIFGSAFFMLSRYEEYFKELEDTHKRFPASASIAYRNGFLDRPIVNEYLEILWRSLKKLWPGIRRKQRSFRLIPTHDVDLPYEYLGQSFRKLMLKSAVDVYHGLNCRQVLSNIIRWIKINGADGQDPYDTHDWLMSIAEKENLKATFNFMSGGRLPADYYYSIKGRYINRLIKRIIGQGHEIGFHPSYLTAFDGRLWDTEFEKFKKVLNGYPVKGGRQHFLRFQIPYTWRYWAGNNLEYDSTMGFADHAGFRCGTCYEFPVYDLKRREVLPLRERPLIAMDTSVIDDHYMGMGTTAAAVDYFLKLKRFCQDHHGDFVILWHNQRFVDPEQKEMYRTIIS